MTSPSPLPLDTMENIREALGFVQDLKSAASKMTIDQIQSNGDWDMNDIGEDLKTKKSHSKTVRHTTAGVKAQLQDQPLNEEIAALIQQLKLKYIVEFDTMPAEFSVSKAHAILEDYDSSTANAMLSYFSRFAINKLENTILDSLPLHHKLGTKIITWKEPNHSNDEDFAPRIITQEDQNCIDSLPHFMIMRPPDNPYQTGEVHVERNVGTPISSLFEELNASWKQHSNTLVDLLDTLSKSTKGAKPDICIQSQWRFDESSNTLVEILKHSKSYEGAVTPTVPGAVVFIAEAKKTSNSRSAAIAQMALVLHPTLIMLIMLYHRDHGFKYNMDKAKILEAEEQIPAEYFIPSVFYSDQEISILANYPTIATDHTPRGNNTRWRMKCENLVKYDISSRMNDAKKFTFYVAMLAVFRHVQRLKQIWTNQDNTRYFKEILEHTAKNAPKKEPTSEAIEGQSKEGQSSKQTDGPRSSTPASEGGSSAKGSAGGSKGRGRKKVTIAQPTK
ncbi:uncharacterized protein B0H18DRAFT_606222 [Fomitopsis serialis]|uniref:uncharacterized protein n=1 Tax=Fomitopsis serialis TaxID=139415 RepID=UPI002007D3A9|nr:uncharacterized protein B0H18DRAFT_606222 [Neoantrodia serialis]KAH9933923.1 hypothetical protein B0H18DRAFT_606222 [Neoantrodia serialis]